jgi:hypothetical protein
MVREIAMRSGMFASALVTSAVLSLATPASAFGYEDTGFDPNDRINNGWDPDIASTTRKVWAAANGHRYLTVTLRAYEDFSLQWYAIISVDSRGGTLRDYRIYIGSTEFSGHGCSVLHRGQHFRHVKAGAFKQRHGWARCRVPLRFVQPNKRIRWKVYSPRSLQIPTSREYAPNHGGWYG